MFGFLKPSCSNRRTNHSAYKSYRQVYAAFCAHHRNRYGVLASALISYEAVFLYHLAIESGACSPPTANTPHCCRLRSDPTNRWNLDRELADFCSDFGLLLVQIKIEDDVRDSRSVVARTAQRLWKRKFGMAQQRLENVSPGLIKQINDLVDKHLSFESLNNTQNSNHRITNKHLGIREYAQPTADSFRLIFEGFGKLCEKRGGDTKEFGAIGEDVGRSILAGDCCMDFERDLERGEFNPLSNNEQKQDAISLSLQSLSRLGWACNDLAANNSISGIEKTSESVLSTVVASAFKRVSGLRDSIAAPAQKYTSLKKYAALKFGARGGFCDCDCGGCDCGGCDCGDCGACDGGDCGGSEGCGMCDWCGDSDTTHINGCDCLYCGNTCENNSSTNKKKSKIKIENATLHEITQKSRGITVGPLNPTGVILIEGEEKPAKSMSGFIPDGTHVEVIKQDTFGLVVDRIRKS